MLACGAQGSYNNNHGWNCPRSEICRKCICMQIPNVVKCDLECNGTHYMQAETCRLKCTCRKCVQECNFHECSQQCNGEHRTQTCRKGTCSLQRNRTKYKQTCFRDCNLTCSRESCDQNCSERTWQIHYSVAGHSGKCQQCCQSKDSKRTKTIITITEALTRISEHYHTSTGE